LTPHLAGAIADSLHNRLVPWLVAAACFAAPPATAQIDPEPNGLGIYFDEGGTTNCREAAAGDLVTAYLVVTRLEESAGGIAGFECGISYYPGTVQGGVEYELPAGAVNVLTPPSFSVGLASPLPQAPVITLLTLRFISDGNPVLLGAGCRQDLWSDPPCPILAGANDPGQFIVLTPSGDTLFPGRERMWVVAGVNAGPTCPIAVEAQTWSRIKAIYGAR
jgi:hypothetical protein